MAKLRWVRLRSRPERQTNGVIVHNGVATDITEAVAHQEKLRQSEAMLRAVGDNLPDSVVYRFTRDTAGNAKFLYVSAGVERLAGVTVEEVHGGPRRVVRAGPARNTCRCCWRLNKPPRAT